jgi:superoxide dismutase, Cu-Zn family
MRVDRLLCAATALLGLACFPFSAAAQVAKAELKDASGKSIGEANFSQTNNGVLIRLEVKGLPAGERAFHVHAVGKCEPPFTTAGDHFTAARSTDWKRRTALTPAICQTFTFQPVGI